MTKGHAAPEVARAVHAGPRVVSASGRHTRALPVPVWSVTFYVARPQLHTAQSLAEQLLRLAQRAQSALLVAHRYSDTTYWGLPCSVGEPLWLPHSTSSRHCCTMTASDIASCARLRYRPRLVTRAWMALTLWLLGYPDQALTHIQEAWTLAHELSHPYSLAAAQILLAWLHQFRRRPKPSTTGPQTASPSRPNRDLPSSVAWGTVPHGWALTRQEQWARHGHDPQGAAGSRRHRGSDAPPILPCAARRSLWRTGPARRRARLAGRGQDRGGPQGERY